MKKLLPLLAIAAATLAGTGCQHNVGVTNPDDSRATYGFGSLTTFYTAKTPDYIENVNNATKKALEKLHYYRKGESPRTNGIKHYAQYLDTEITVDISKYIQEEKDGTKIEKVKVVVRYGNLGDCPRSQQIVATISDFLNGK